MSKKQMEVLFLISIFCIIISGCKKQGVPTNTSPLITDISSLTVPETVKIVGLGEASHGVSEYQKMKMDVFQALVANHNCNTFIMEGDFGGSLKVEEYIHGGSGTAQEAVSEIGFAIYQTQEMVDLVEWMRSYNETSPVDGDLHFYGMDVQRYDNNKEYLFQVLDAALPDLSKQYKHSFSSLTDENRLNLDKSILKQSESDALALLKEMDNRESKIVGIVPQNDFDFARECAKSIYECTKLLRSNTDYNTLRDSYMAEKVNWFMEYGSGDMLFINGHNGHIGKLSAYGYPCLGGLLTKQYADAYFSIGTDAMNTSFNSQQDNGFEEMKVANKNSLTRVTDVVGSDYYYLDFATVIDDEEWQKVITSPQKMTALNVGIPKWQQKISLTFTKKISPIKTYNGVIIFRDVKPSTLLSDSH